MVASKNKNPTLRMWGIIQSVRARYNNSFFNPGKLAFNKFNISIWAGTCSSPANLKTQRYSFAFWRQSTRNNCARETLMSEKEVHTCNS